MDRSSALPGQPCQGQGPSSLADSLNGVTPAHSDQGSQATHKIQRSILQRDSETILNIDIILERLKISNSSMKQQVRDLQTNRGDLENEEDEAQFQSGGFFPIGPPHHEQQNNLDHHHLDLLSFDIPHSEAFTSLLEDYKDTMDFLRRFLPSSSRPEPSEPRDLSRHSRMIDGWIDIDRDPASQGSWLNRMLANTGLRRLWSLFVESRDPRTRAPAPTTSGRALISLPTEVLTEVINRSELNDMDRLRFGATCARAMSVTLPVLYRYAMVRYPIKKRPLNETLKDVGHMVRELIIHMPEAAEPVRNEDDFIEPYDIFNKMTGLTALTIYFDAPVAAVEVVALLKYFLRANERLTHITLDIQELKHPLAAYESRTVYHASRAIESLRSKGALGNPARLEELSLCIQKAPQDTSASAVCQVFQRHCERARYLRVLPHLRRGQTLDLAPFRSRQLDHIQWVVRDGTPATTSIYAPVLQAAVNPRSINLMRVFVHSDAQFVVDRIKGYDDPALEFPFNNLVMMWIECVGDVPQAQTFHANAQLQQDLRSRAEGIFRAAPTLRMITCMERGVNFTFYIHIFKSGDGTVIINTSQFP
ncbi:hypothetical protein TWF481_005272 [Arthrobotrys musiformis]|uniref:F-box domain-containing protein n=1 Tax=Arthrobotrys musiformis TaxID=47236 RepID=A0AAV9WEY0_9PEZI